MLILACYIASYNPTKSDMRIFGRDPSGIPKRKNRGYAKGKGKVSTTKVSLSSATLDLHIRVLIYPEWIRFRKSY